MNTNAVLWLIGGLLVGYMVAKNSAGSIIGATIGGSLAEGITRTA